MVSVEFQYSAMFPLPGVLILTKSAGGLNWIRSAFLSRKKSVLFAVNVAKTTVEVRTYRAIVKTKIRLDISCLSQMISRSIALQACEAS